MKYIGALHTYIQHDFLLFNPTSLDEVCAQATHLENRGKNVQEDPTKKPSNFPKNTFKKFKEGQEDCYNNERRRKTMLHSLQEEWS
jgi:hypothetical protein